MKKILVVDDDEGILDAITVLLESSNYNVSSSSDGDIINKLDEKNLPDLILLDVLLSGVDGRELCKQLKNNDLTKKIPVIMLSAHPGAEMSVRDFGADDFIPKPFEMNDLLEKIKKHIKSSKTRGKKN